MPLLGFEPRTFRLQGGCSNQLSYNGIYPVSTQVLLCLTGYVYSLAYVIGCWQLFDTFFVSFLFCLVFGGVSIMLCGGFRVGFYFGFVSKSVGVDY